MLISLLFAYGALAQDPVDIGVVSQSDLVVVQDLLYPKAHRTELSVNLGIMPWDTYTFTPTAQFGLDLHRTESFAWSAALGVGYGFKSGTYRELEVEYGVAPYAYRYLGSALVGVSWAPLYGKLNLDGARIVHFDGFLSVRGGATLQTSIIPDGGTPLAPTLALSVGTRLFLRNGTSLRIELRDDLMARHQKLTSSWKFHQNAMILVGVGFLSKARQ